MVADLVPLRDHPAHQLRVLLDPLPDHEEVRMNPLALERIEDALARSEVRPVVEGQQQLGPVATAALQKVVAGAIKIESGRPLTPVADAEEVMEAVGDDPQTVEPEATANEDEGDESESNFALSHLGSTPLLPIRVSPLASG